MYKMILIDLDGTLLNDYKEIPEENIEAINRLYDRFGIIPVIATARPLEVARYISRQGGRAFQKYILATNGAMLYDVENDEYLVNKSIGEGQLIQLIEICEKYDIEYEIMTSECEVADVIYSYRRVVDPMYDNMGVKFNYQENLREYILGSQQPIPLFAISGTEEELGQYVDEFRRIAEIQMSAQCLRTTPEADSESMLKPLVYYDIMRKGVTKASAIEVLAEHLGIAREEVIAIRRQRERYGDVATSRT